MVIRGTGFTASIGRRALSRCACSATRTAALSIVTLVATLAGARAQQRAPTPDWQMKAGNAMQFEVASVKQNRGDNPPPDMNVPMGPGEIYKPVGGLFRATDMPLAMYINFAYKVTGDQEEALVKQLPTWARAERFDIEARAAGEPTKDQMRLMMQSLLKERFGFILHYEMREASVYVLVVAKPGKVGPQLRPHPGNAPCANQVSADQSGHPTNWKEARTDSDGFPALCGGIEAVPAKTRGAFAFGARDISMKRLAESLTAAEQLGRPIVDQTGLTGNYDFWMEWTQSPDSRLSAPQQTTAPPVGENDGPSFLEALTEQLGLKLKSEKSEIQQIVVDHLDHLSPN